MKKSLLLITLASATLSNAMQRTVQIQQGPLTKTTYQNGSIKYELKPKSGSIHTHGYDANEKKYSWEAIVTAIAVGDNGVTLMHNGKPVTQLVKMTPPTASHAEEAFKEIENKFNIALQSQK